MPTCKTAASLTISLSDHTHIHTVIKLCKHVGLIAHLPFRLIICNIIAVSKSSSLSNVEFHSKIAHAYHRNAFVSAARSFVIVFLFFFFPFLFIYISNGSGKTNDDEQYSWRKNCLDFVNISYAVRFSYDILSQPH